MKTILTAVALTIAAPAFAQGNAPADPHAGHAKMDCCKEMQAKGKECCCCDKDKAAADAHAGHDKADPHAGHAPSPK